MIQKMTDLRNLQLVSMNSFGIVVFILSSEFRLLTGKDMIAAYIPISVFS